MNTGQRYIFGKKDNIKHNVWLGNVADVLSTPLDIVNSSTLNGVGDIENFEISNNNIKFFSSIKFDFNSSFFRSISISYLDHLNIMELFQKDLFRSNRSLLYLYNHSTGTVASSYTVHDSKCRFIYYPNCNSSFGGIRSYTSMGDSPRIYAPRATDMQFLNTLNNLAPFSGEMTLYLRSDYDSGNYSNLVRAANEVINNGGSVVKVFSFNIPEKITDLTLTIVGPDSLQFNFTKPLDSEFFEVWHFQEEKGCWVMLGEIYNSGDIHTVPLSESIYPTKIKITTCDQYWNGSGMNDSEEKKAFSNPITL